MTTLEKKVKFDDGEFYLVNFPVGDWSRDGHEKFDLYLIRSKKPVMDIRKAHLKSYELFGFDIGSLCSRDEKMSSSNQIFQKLKELGYDFDRLSEISNDPDCYGDDLSNLDLNSECILDIWLFLLNKINSALDLKVLSVPSIAYFGLDEQDRELRIPGYGCFN